MLPAMALPGCGGGGGAEAGTGTAAGAAVLQLNEAAALVEPDTIPGSFALTFGSPIDIMTVGMESVTVVRDDGTFLQGTLSLDESRRHIFFAPWEPLPVLARFRVHLGTGLKDLSGNALATPTVLEMTARDGSFDPQGGIPLPGTGPQPQDRPMDSAIDRAGNAVIAFVRANPATGALDLHALLYSVARQAWGEPELLQAGTPGPRGIDGIRVALDPDGNAMVGWLQPPALFPGERSLLHARRFDAVNGWEPTAVLSLPTKAAYDHRLLADASGNFMAVWLQRERTDGGPFIGVMARRYVRAVGAWEPQSVLVQDEAPSLMAGGLRTGIDAAGNVDVAWFRGVVGGGHIVSNRYDTATGAWAVNASIGMDIVGPPMDVDFPALETGQAPQLAVARDGAAVAAWLVYRADDPEGVFHELRAAVRPPGPAEAAWSAPVTLSLDPEQRLGNLAVGVDDAGGAVALWVRNTMVGGAPSAQLLLRRWNPESQAWGPEEPVPAPFPANLISHARLFVHGPGHLLALHFHGNVPTPGLLAYSRFDANQQRWSQVLVPVGPIHGDPLRMVTAANPLGHCLAVGQHDTFRGHWFR